MKIVIVGAGAVGTHLSKLLSREHQDCVLIDGDEERLSTLSEYDVMTYQASPTSIQALKDAGVEYHKEDLFRLNSTAKKISRSMELLAEKAGKYPDISEFSGCNL